MDEAVARVIREFDVSPDRAALLAEIAEMQRGHSAPGGGRVRPVHRHSVLHDALLVLLVCLRRDRRRTAGRAVRRGARARDPAVRRDDPRARAEAARRLRRRRDAHRDSRAPIWTASSRRRSGRFPAPWSGPSRRDGRTRSTAEKLAMLQRARRRAHLRQPADVLGRDARRASAAGTPARTPCAPTSWRGAWGLTTSTWTSSPRCRARRRRCSRARWTA